MKILKIGVVALVAASLSGCYASREGAGTAIGAGIGGLVGSQFGGNTSGRLAGALIGVVVGGIIGNRIGAAMDARDREYHEMSRRRALAYGNTGRPVRWRNPRSGNSGYVRPTSPWFRGPDGRRCRRFREAVRLRDGQTRVVRGMRCQNPDGSWEYLG